MWDMLRPYWHDIQRWTVTLSIFGIAVAFAMREFRLSRDRRE